MSDIAWLFVAFAVVWVVLGLYLVSLGTRQRGLAQRLAELESIAARREEGPDEQVQTHNL